MLVAHNLVEAYRGEIAEKLGELVRIPSVKGNPEPGMPFGAPLAAALSWALAQGAGMGLSCVNVDNYAGHVDFGSGDEIVGVLSHLDVVPPGEGWSFPPFCGEFRDGRVLGRGSADNKCSAVAALYSIKILASLGVVPKRKIRLIFGTDEENGSSDMPRYFARMPLPDLAFVPDSGCAITNREKGRLVVRLVARTQDSAVRLKAGLLVNMVPDLCELGFVDTPDSIGAEQARADSASADPAGADPARSFGTRVYRGKSWHGAWPKEGINAVALALADLRASGIETRNPLLEFLASSIAGETDGRSLGIALSDEPSGELTLNLGLVDACRPISAASLDIRYPVTCASGPIVESLAREAGRFGVDVEVRSDNPPLFVDENGELVRKLKLAFEKSTGERAVTESMGGRTYASCLKGRGVAFGPGAGEGAHQNDEYVDMDKLMRHLRISTQALWELACAD